MKEKLAMPCTQEQWEQEIKPRIEKIQGVFIEDISEYCSTLPYITNEYDGVMNYVGNTCNTIGRIIIPYDPDCFCASLGVEQPEWMPLTRGGYEYHIYEEFDEYLFGRISIDGKWCTSRWGNNGKFFENKEETNSWDLMPYDNEIEAIKKEIAIKEKELEKLKGKLK